MKELTKNQTLYRGNKKRGGQPPIIQKSMKGGFRQC